MPRDKALVSAELWKSPDVQDAFAGLRLRSPGVSFLAGCAFYTALIQMSDFSFCFEMDPRVIKMYVDPGGLLTIDDVKAMLDALVAAGKVVPYDHAGKTYGYIPNAHKHQSYRYPARPKVPLPDWVRFVPDVTGGRQHRYEFGDHNAYLTFKRHAERAQDVSQEDSDATLPDQSQQESPLSEAMNRVIHKLWKTPERTEGDEG